MICLEYIVLVEILIEFWFIFVFVWFVGGICDGDGRKKFSEYLRKKMDDEKVIFNKIYVFYREVYYLFNMF